MSDGVRIIHNGKVVDTGNPLPISVTGAIGPVDSITFTGGQNFPNIWNITKDDTGFIEGCIVTGNGTNKTVTLTGTVAAYWKGARITALTSGWTSPAHGTDTSKVYYLYSSDGTAPTWSESLWSFDYLQVAFAFYDATLGWVYERECHGFMPHDCHENDHFNLGAWRQSGGDISNIVLSSTTAANRRPYVSSLVHHDEDLETTQAAISTNSYTNAALTSTGIATFTESNTDIVPLLVNNPYYNSFTTPNWGQTLMPANSCMSIWLVSIPMAADTNSQYLRFVWGQGQWITQATSGSAPNLATALAAEKLRKFSEMNLGNLQALSPEFLPIARIIITYTASNWYVSYVENLTGSRFQQTGGQGGTFLSTVTTDGTLTGVGTVASPLSVVETLGISIDSITYNADGTVNVVTTANGTQTYSYNADGTVNTITGTGIYKTETFTWSSGLLVSTLVA